MSVQELATKATAENATIKCKETLEKNKKQTIT